MAENWHFTAATRFKLLGLFVLLLLLTGVSASSGLGQPASDGPMLRLRWGEFDPTTGSLPPTPADLQSNLEPDQAGLRLVQFSAPIEDAWYQAMLDSGLFVVSYMPDYAYLVWGDQAAVERLAKVAPLRWQGDYLPAYALHPALLDAALGAGGSGQDDKPIESIQVNVQMVDLPAVQSTRQAILAEAVLLQPPYHLLTYQNLSIQIAAQRLTWLASLPGVVDVAPRPKLRLLDERQGQIMAGNLNAGGTAPSAPGYLNWLISKGFPTDPSSYPIVDVTDDGIDNGSATPIHADFYRLGTISQGDRLIYNYNWTSDPSADGGGGHGNLNAAVVVGYNNLTGNTYRDPLGYQRGLGINPFGRVAGSKVFSNNGSWSFNGLYSDLIGNSYNLGARISTNSWGGSTYGDYVQDDQAYDALVRDASPSITGNQPITILFAAGNDGPSLNTTSSPGNAKNVITVGASENYRTPFETYSYDQCGISTNGADSAQDIALFSSRGPTDDQRIKPDIVAPGTMILGAASQSAAYNGGGVCIQYYPSGQTLYAASSGTSHSTPAAAGAASLLDYFYRVNFGGQSPSPAMAKAYLVNSARYLTGSGANDTLPSPNQGFGRVDLGRAFDQTPRFLVDQTTTFASTGQIYEFNGAIIDSQKPLRVTLAWTDAPGSTVGDSYVNNLDLEVIVNGQTYRGNVFSGANSITGGLADARNNVESVFLPAGASGPITVRVWATNIAGDGVPGNSDPTDQDFALVVYNASNQAGTLQGVVRTASGNNPIPGATVEAKNPGGVAFRMTTAADGSYNLLLGVNTYTVSAWKFGYSLQSVSGVSIQNNQTTTRDFMLSSAPVHTLSGCITDQITGQGLAATVQALSPLGDLAAQTQTSLANHCYQLDLSDGSYTLRVESRLHQTQEVAQTLSGDTVRNFTLVATTTDGLLLGRVLSSSGTGVGSASVVITPGNYQPAVGSDGSFEIQLPHADYSVMVSAPNYAPITETVTIPQSNLVERDFILPSPVLNVSAPTQNWYILPPGGQFDLSVQLQNAGDFPVDFRVYESDGRPISGGPDLGGYIYLDSRTTSGVGYSWIDATDGTRLNLGDDEETNVPMPFPFTFYGIPITNLRVGNNGAILMNVATGELDYSNVDLASVTTPMIAPFWDDLDSDTGFLSYKTVGQSPNRRFVIEWHNRPRYQNIGNSTFEVILYEGSNNLKLQYQDVVFGDSRYDNGRDATVGIRGNNAYLQVSYNQAYLANQTALCFQAPGSLPCDPVDLSWLSVSSTQGTLPISAAQGLIIHLNMSTTGRGAFPGAVRLWSNDPRHQPFLEIPIVVLVDARLSFLPIIGR
jgi:hypothetical protein